MKSSHRFIAFLLILTLIAAPVLPVLAAEAGTVIEAVAEAANINKHGNVILSTTCEELMDAGFVNGDVLEVRFLDRTLALPLCGHYSDVDSGTAGIFARAEDTNVVLAVNMGDFATSYGIAVKTEKADQTIVWSYAEGVEGPVLFRISLIEAGGYYVRQLSYSDARSDYPALTDAQFANFRAVRTTGMGGTLFRSASPLNPAHNRNSYADAALRSAGVTVVMNLADTAETARSYENYADSYYASVDSITLGMGMDFAAEDFQAKLAEGLRYLAAHPGVYAVHCTKGKDRTGFVCALLECLMGGSYDEIIADYMETYYNYYGVTKDDARWDAIASSNIVKSLQRAFHVDELQTADLAGLAKAYIKEIGLSDAELAMLMDNLSANKTAAQTQSPEKILAAMTTEEKVAQNVFSDLENDAWYVGSVVYVLGQGIMAGYGNGAFGTRDPLSRAQMAIMLWRMEGEPAAGYDMPFRDVREDAWYAAAVRWAASAEIVTGTAETNFAPDTGLTREEAAVILYRYAAAQAPGSTAALAEFADSAEISDWAQEAMGWAVDAGIMRGSGGFLRPKDNLTRAEAAQLIYYYAAQKAA